MENKKSQTEDENKIENNNVNLNDLNKEQLIQLILSYNLRLNNRLEPANKIKNSISLGDIHIESNEVPLETLILLFNNFIKEHEALVKEQRINLRNSHVG